MSSEAAKKAWATRRANGYTPKTSATRSPRPRAQELFLTPAERQMLAALDETPRAVRYFVGRCQVKTSTCGRALRKLEAHGLAEHVTNGITVEWRRTGKGVR